MVSICTVPARGGRSCEHFGGYKTINRIPLKPTVQRSQILVKWLSSTNEQSYNSNQVSFLTKDFFCSRPQVWNQDYDFY